LGDLICHAGDWCLEAWLGETPIGDVQGFLLVEDPGHDGSLHEQVLF